MAKHRPIIKSLLDTDFYKFTMGQLIFLKYFWTIVAFAFKNRTIKVRLADHIDENELRWQLDHVRTLRFRPKEIAYLESLCRKNGKPMFVQRYLDFLSQLQLPNYTLKKENGTYVLRFEGRWAEVIYWETLALSIINELYYRSLMNRNDRRRAYRVGRKRLWEKIEILKTHPQIIFSDFGTRRRFSRWWQEYVVSILAKELPSAQFLGTSNVYLAMKYNLKPIGTCAHEMFMGMSGIMHESDETIRASHNQVLKDWCEVYDDNLLIALTDTYGSEFFFQDMTAGQARFWDGLRQDSGDPFEFGEKAIAFYLRHGIDPATKLIVFSDGLDIKIMMSLSKYFNGRIKIAFGWGTNLTNDLGMEALSLVVKLIESCGFGTVKLSDNIAKAMGELLDIERFKCIFGYTGTFNQACTY